MKTTTFIITLLISMVCTVSAFAIDVKLQWDANTESDLAGYKVYYGVDSLSNPTSVDVHNHTLTTIASLDPGLKYVFAVKAYNTSGMEAPYSNQVTVLESVLPIVSIVSPANNAQVMNTVSITSNASDNVGVTKVEYYVDGVLKSTDAAAPYQYDWDTFSAAAGTHNITAKAYDAAGNIGVSSITVVVVKDTTPPAVSFTSPAAGIVSGTVNVSCNASDNIGVTMVEFYVNGVIRAAVNTAPYNYSWDTTTISDGAYTLIAKAYDGASNSTTSSAVVTVKNQVSDTTGPVVSAFTMPATANSLTVAVSSLTATDAFGVTGYMITENSTAPIAGASGWSATVPTTFTFSSAGSKTAYAWAKDVAGNVSASASRTVTITLADVTAPVISAFTMPATATSLTVAVSSLTATDATGVTGYMITESSTVPTAGASGWSATVPTNFTFSAAGTIMVYAWAKDAAGNVSASASRTVTITLADVTAPVISAFTMPAKATSLTVAVSSLTATDAIGITGYMITENSTAPTAGASGWSATAPITFTFSAAGSTTAFAWAKDAAGNVSAGKSALVTITLSNTVTYSIGDALQALRIASGKVKGTSDQISRLDVAPVVNGKSVPNGTINSGDVTVIMSKLVGKSSL